MYLFKICPNGQKSKNLYCPKGQSIKYLAYARSLEYFQTFSISFHYSILYFQRTLVVTRDILVRNYFKMPKYDSSKNEKSRSKKRAREPSTSSDDAPPMRRPSKKSKSNDGQQHNIQPYIQPTPFPYPVPFQTQSQGFSSFAQNNFNPNDQKPKKFPSRSRGRGGSRGGKFARNSEKSQSIFGRRPDYLEQAPENYKPEDYFKITVTDGDKHDITNCRDRACIQADRVKNNQIAALTKKTYAFETLFKLGIATVCEKFRIDPSVDGVGKLYIFENFNNKNSHKCEFIADEPDHPYSATDVVKMLRGQQFSVMGNSDELNPAHLDGQLVNFIKGLLNRFVITPSEIVMNVAAGVALDNELKTFRSLTRNDDHNINILDKVALVRPKPNSPNPKAKQAENSSTPKSDDEKAKYYLETFGLSREHFKNFQRVFKEITSDEEEESTKERETSTHQSKEEPQKPLPPLPPRPTPPPPMPPTLLNVAGKPTLSPRKATEQADEVAKHFDERPFPVRKPAIDTAALQRIMNNFKNRGTPQNPVQEVDQNCQPCGETCFFNGKKYFRIAADQDWIACDSEEN